MKTKNSFLAVHNLGLIQRQAGVEPEIADLITASARILTNAGRPLSFEEKVFKDGSPQRRIQERLSAKNRNLDPKFISFLASYGGKMIRRGYPVIFNKADFCRQIGISEKTLNWVCFNQHKCYRSFSLPKKNGKSRIILDPNPMMRHLQRWIQNRILSRTKPPSCTHGFVKGRSILTNSKPHIGKKVIIRLDIEEFFPSIKYQTIRNVFQRIGYPYGVAVFLANICVVNGRLPQGAITSPTLSNLVCVKLDERFSGLSKKLSFKYTRYADDLIFSSNNSKLPCLIPFFSEILLEEGFKIQEHKTKIMRQGYRQVVTGIVSNKKANLPRTHIRQLRAALHRLKKGKPDEVSINNRLGDKKNPLNQIQGHIAFLEMVNQKKANPYKKSIKMLLS